LGCGAGVFTLALAELLPSSNLVIGVDRNYQNLPKQSTNGVSISFLQADFSDNLLMENVDGILLANALHYISEQEKLIHHLAKLKKNQPNFLFIEYDTNSSNRWVPYPVSWLRLQSLFTKEN